MDSGIKIHKVPQVVLEGSPSPNGSGGGTSTHAQSQSQSQSRLVDLHLTPHHTILSHASSQGEIWVAHSLLLSVHLHAPSRDPQARTPLVIRTRTYDSYRILFTRKQDAKAVYESLEAVLTRRVSPEQLYAYTNPPEASATEGWQVYEPKREFGRMGVFDTDTSKARTSAWRFTSVNSSFEYCPTYPSTLVVPAKISDATLNYGKAYRSKCRIPGLVYLHWANLGSITRSSQPMVGLKNNRSIQDEKLIEAVFTSHSYHHARSDMANASYISHSYSVYGATPTNLIIDARPTTNAMANVAKGAGTENMEHYRNCKKVYLGIDNIHVMRDSLAKVSEAIRVPNETNYDLLRRSGWLKHLSCILEGIVIIVKAIHLANSHVLVHCSDGWDRTSQLSSISQLCLDPYYRTREGFAVLVEKDWISYGHQFGNRAGHLAASRVHFTDTSGPDYENGDEEVGFLASMQQKLNFGGGGHGFRETCPVFDQFLDTVYQLQVQFPERFEFNEPFLLDLQKELYECRFGNFLYNSEKERTEAGVAEKTASVWAEMLSPANESKYRNPAWISDDKEVLFPDAKKVQWWTRWFKREDMNAIEMQLAVLPSEPHYVESKADDPVLTGVASASVHAASESDAEQARSPTAAAGMSLPINMDSAAISQASTAVQGAMRSAWSAWKSVRSSYDGAMKELKEPAADGLHAPQLSASSRPASRPASPNPIRKADPPPGTADQRPPAFNPSQSRYREHSELSQNPWKTADTAAGGGDADPLGVKVWS